MNHGLKLSCLLPLALAGLGCMGVPEGGGAGDEPLGEAKQAYSGYWSYGWGTVGDSDPRALLGPASQMTCFLSSATGAFNYESLVGAQNDGENWWIVAYNGTNQEVGATVVCVPNANAFGVVEYATSVYSGPVALAADQKNTRCFITYVTAGTDANEWSHAGDVAEVYSSGGTWWANGTGDVSFATACIEVENNFGIQTNWTSGSSATTLNMWHGPNGGTNPLGTQCALTGLGGSFRDSNWNDGVTINYSSSQQEWSMTVSANKTGWANCFQ